VTIQFSCVIFILRRVALLCACLPVKAYRFASVIKDFIGAIHAKIVMVFRKNISISIQTIKAGSPTATFLRHAGLFKVFLYYALCTIVLVINRIINGNRLADVPALCTRFSVKTCGADHFFHQVSLT
jgi:hypothetical protein